MEWFIALVAVIVIGVAAVAASGRLGEFTAAQTDRPEPLWPDGPLASADIDDLGFAVVPRGYAMDQVDEFCERVKARLAELEASTRHVPARVAEDFESPLYDDYDDDEDYDHDPPEADDDDHYVGSVASPLRAIGATPRRLSAWR